MKSKLLVLVLFASAALFGQVSLGVRIGPPPPPRVMVQGVSPGPGYSYVGGYWYPVSGHYRWHQAYWTRPPYEGAVWVGPNHDGTMYYNGHWEGAHGRVEHDHRWDRNHDRDYRHDR
jgi:hypothetical protein